MAADHLLLDVVDECLPVDLCAVLEIASSRAGVGFNTVSVLVER